MRHRPGRAESARPPSDLVAPPSPSARPRQGRSRRLMASLTVGAVVAATSMAVGLAGTLSASPAAAATATSGGINVAYFDQWSIYQNAFYVKNLDTEGIAGKLTYLIYDFENINPTSLNCFEAEKATDPDPGGESDPSAGDGAGDMDADYGKPFPANEAVNGVADSSTQALAGNFNQLRELKAKYPNLKILLSIGGWTYSKYFSSAAASAASRTSLVNSCINMFIDGNLPSDSDYGPTYGGTGSAAGIFDGFDIDWEYPGSTDGHLGNITSPNDTANYTALLSAFRTGLNTAGTANNKTYYLSAALPSGQNNIAEIQTNQIGQYLTFGDVMSYDMYGAWNATGPADEQDPLYANPNSPETKVAPGNQTYSINNAMQAWTVGDPSYSIVGGFPANKLTLGVPFYYRGWTGVPAGPDHGLYQTATGPSAGQTDSGDVPGVAMYKELLGTVNNAADTYWDPITQAAYFYDGTNFYGGEDAESIQAQANYVHCNGFAGFMMFSLYDLDPSATLFNDATSDMAGSASSCTTPSGTPTSTSPTTAPPTTTPPTTTPPTTTPPTTKSPTTAPPTTTPPTTTPPTTTPPTGGNLIVNGSFQSGALSPWTCSPLDTVVTTPVYTGDKYALSGAASSSDDAQCSQVVTVKPSTTYTLSAEVDGAYVFLGISGTGATATDTWTPGTSGFQSLSLSFTTTSTATSITVYLHGWYGEGTFYADNTSLVV
jgi:chitinase